MQRKNSLHNCTLMIALGKNIESEFYFNSISHFIDILKKY